MDGDRWSARRARGAALLALGLVAVAVVPAQPTHAAFVGPTSSQANSLTAFPDWTPPIITRASAWKPEGGTPGFLRSPGSYRIIAHVVDDPSANQPAGLRSVTSLNGPSTLQLAPFTLQGLEYTHIGQSIPIAAGRANANVGISVRADDLNTPALVTETPAAGQPGALQVVLDSTAPVPTFVDVANAAANAGKPEQSDVLTYGWGEPIEPHYLQPSVPATTPPTGWSGAAATPVTVRINNNVAGFGNNDTVTVDGVPLGTINLGNNAYVTAVVTFPNSQMTWITGGTRVQIVLGAPSGATGDVNANLNAAWTANAGVIDRAGNPSAAGPYTELNATTDPNF